MLDPNVSGGGTESSDYAFHRSREECQGQVWPGRTAFPDSVTTEARLWWSELNMANVRSGLAGIWNDMNEPATGDIPPDSMRFGRGEFPNERYRNQYTVYTEGRTARQVYPPSSVWYHWHTGNKFPGRKFVLKSTPMDHIPLYVRGGAIIPTWPQAPHSTMDYHPDTVEMNVFAPAPFPETTARHYDHC